MTWQAGSRGPLRPVRVFRRPATRSLLCKPDAAALFGAPSLSMCGGARFNSLTMRRSRGEGLHHCFRSLKNIRFALTWPLDARTQTSWVQVAVLNFRIAGD